MTFYQFLSLCRGHVRVLKPRPRRGLSRHIPRQNPGRDWPGYAQRRKGGRTMKRSLAWWLYQLVAAACIAGGLAVILLVLMGLMP